MVILKKFCGDRLSIYKGSVVGIHLNCYYGSNESNATVEPLAR
jgi:hypothetical protein